MRIMVNSKLCSNLIVAELLSNAPKDSFKYIKINASGITTTYVRFLGNSIGFLRSATSGPFVPYNQYRNARLDPAKVIDNLSAIQFLFRKAKNLISLDLVGLFIGHGNLAVNVIKL